MNESEVWRPAPYQAQAIVNGHKDLAQIENQMHKAGAGL